ncbi:putative B3 domain-containing protein [Cardamine amara subsp. amara]|uniref:B3 domain-containing protein n=1 Tax=Cardamine amara subsp. amara TaxID=228776 RepID=A0ABD1BL93_CARAN
MSSVYYNDHHTALGNKTWSDFYLLVDVAVKVAEEESRERIFHVFPRKPRSSLTKRIYPKQNLNKASSSSSLLFDLNQIPTDSETQDPQLQWLSSSSSCFITADSKTQSLKNPRSEPFSLTLLLGYNTDDESEKMEMKNPRNPSSEPSSSTLLLDYTMTQSKMTETKEPLNPNSQYSLTSSCLMEKPSLKRRAVQERKRTSGFKKPKLAPFLHTARETPEWLVQVMRDMKGAEDAKLIFEKTLFTTDVNPTQNRLSMPFNSLLRSDFLTPVESRTTNEDINNNKKIGVGAILVDQRCEKWGVMLKRWEMKKERGKGSWNYNLICGWNEVVKANGLKERDDISLWSFRSCGLLCFAMEQSSSSLVLALC